MTDTFIASARRSLRKSFFQRFAPLGLGQDATLRLVCATATAALRNAAVADLAEVGGAVGSLRSALAAVAPDDPALAEFDAVMAARHPAVRELVASE